MNYRELKQWINSLTIEEQERDVLVFSDETGRYLPVYCADKSVESDQIVDGHPILIY